MKCLALSLVLLALVNTARADTVFKVGVATRDFIPAEPYDWRGARTHALRAIIWYPAVADAREEPQWAGPRFVPFFSAGSAARDAALAAGPPRPLIVLSHGNGDRASSLGWLGTALAAHGFVVVAVNHPGNNALEDYTVEGFSLRWLRAVDLGAVIDAMLDDKTFGNQIDPARIGAAGHSLGGYTVLAAVGGITDPVRLEAFCRSPDADVSCKPAPPFSEMRQNTLARLNSDADFRQRYGAAGKSYRDERIHAVFAMAPGPGPTFTPEKSWQDFDPRRDRRGECRRDRADSLRRRSARQGDSARDPETVSARGPLCVYWELHSRGTSVFSRHLPRSRWYRPRGCPRRDDRTCARLLRREPALAAPAFSTPSVACQRRAQPRLVDNPPAFAP